MRVVKSDLVVGRDKFAASVRVAEQRLEVLTSEGRIVVVGQGLDSRCLVKSSVLHVVYY